MHVACENTVTVNFLLVFLCKPCVFLERTLTRAHDPVTCLCGALSLPEKRRCWKPLTAETQSPNNVLCLCKPRYWLQALMLICFSSSEGGWSNFGWATQNKAVRRFLRQQVHGLHRDTQAVSAGGSRLVALSVCAHSHNYHLCLQEGQTIWNFSTAI